MNYIEKLHAEDRSLDAYMVEDYERLLGNSDRTGEEEAEMRRLAVEMQRIFPSAPKKKRK